MKTAYLFVLLALPPALVWASFERTLTDARVYGMAGAGVAISDVSGSDLDNPAQPALADDLSASSGSVIPFGLTDLAAFSGAVACRKDKAGMGLGLVTLGNRLYRENLLKGSFSFRLTDGISMGGALNCCQLNIERYGSTVAVGLDLGMLGRPAEWVSLGMKAANVNRPALGQDREELSQSLSIGGSVEPVDNVTLSFELYCQRDWPSQLCIGQEYRHRSFLAIRAGFSDRPREASLGFGAIHRNLRVDYAVRTHPDLGLSHCLSVGYIIQRVFAGHQELKIEGAPVAQALPKVDPNTASYDDLCLLPGIGPRAAGDIIAFRDSVGPIRYLDELADVRGIGRAMLEKIAPFVTLGYKPDIPRLIDINLASAGELADLPGIGPKAASDIVAYRQENGPFRSIEDIMNVKGIGRKTYEGIRNLITAGQ